MADVPAWEEKLDEYLQWVAQYGWRWLLGIVLGLVLLLHSGGLMWVVAAVAAYLLPTIVAVSRKAPNRGSVAVVNVLLGWTFLGWVVALAMAGRDKREL